MPWVKVRNQSPTLKGLPPDYPLGFLDFVAPKAPLRIKEMRNAEIRPRWPSALFVGALQPLHPADQVGLRGRPVGQCADDLRGHRRAGYLGHRKPGAPGFIMRWTAAERVPRKCLPRWPQASSRLTSAPDSRRFGTRSSWNKSCTARFASRCGQRDHPAIHL